MTYASTVVYHPSTVHEPNIGIEAVYGKNTYQGAPMPYLFVAHAQNITVSPLFRP